MVHSDSISPTSLGIRSKLRRRWEFEDLSDRGFGQMFPADPYSTLGSAESVQLAPPPSDPTHHQVVIS